MSMPRYDVKQIVAARLKRGWNQTVLAYKAGISVATLSYIECGRRQSPKAVAKVAKVLGLKLEDLVIEDDAVEDAGRPRGRKSA